MVNEGRLAPVVDVVQALRDEAAGAGGKGGGAADDVAKVGGIKSAAKKEVGRCTQASRQPCFTVVVLSSRKCSPSNGPGATRETTTHEA